MKHYIIIAAAILAINCGKKRTGEAILPSSVDTTTVDAAHTSQNSLDYLGRYQGVLPCADCPGIETTVELTEDFNYVITRVYQERNVKPFTETGTFKWNEAGNGIVLSGSDGGKLQFFVGENQLVQLDQEGNRIEGALADKFVLKKLTEAQVIKEETSGASDKLHGKWMITELEGKSIKKTGPKENFLEFRNDGFGAYGGCNTMGGKYEQTGNKLKLSKIMSTMMACPDMTTEDQLKKSLERVDDFVRNEDVLMLRANGEVIIKLKKM